MSLGTTALPLWPALLFTYIEPALLLLGAQTALLTPTEFITSQLPHSPTLPVTQESILLSYTLGSLFLLLTGFAVLCTVLTRDGRVTRGYLVVLMCGDLGHLAANYYGMGSEVFWGWREWNQVMWGNVGVTVFLFVNRAITVVGGFGGLKKGGRGL